MIQIDFEMRSVLIFVNKVGTYTMTVLLVIFLFQIKNKDRQTHYIFKVLSTCRGNLFRRNNCQNVQSRQSSNQI